MRTMYIWKRRATSQFSNHWKRFFQALENPEMGYFFARELTQRSQFATKIERLDHESREFRELNTISFVQFVKIRDQKNAPVWLLLSKVLRKKTCTKNTKAADSSTNSGFYYSC